MSQPRKMTNEEGESLFRQWLETFCKWQKSYRLTDIRQTRSNVQPTAAAQTLTKQWKKPLQSWERSAVSVSTSQLMLLLLLLLLLQCWLFTSLVSSTSQRRRYVARVARVGLTTLSCCVQFISKLSAGVISTGWVQFRFCSMQTTTVSTSDVNSVAIINKQI